MSKQSSVEWLYEEFERIDKDFHFGSYEYNNSKNIALKQAKAMHRVEIIESYASGSNDRLRNTINTNYYNETFGGNNEQS